jgi:hypothetical protein
MYKRTIVISFVLAVGVVAIPIAGFFGWMRHIERQRIRDSDAAFLPLVPLGVTVWSNPVAFDRYCVYVAEFSPGCNLRDANVAELVCLNELPDRNGLDLLIETPALTDSSVPYLKAIRKVDILDVTKSSISDAGILELRKAFPRAVVVERVAHRVSNAPPENGASR